jgi:hypothetical protein
LIRSAYFKYLLNASFKVPNLLSFFALPKNQLDPLLKISD